MTGEAEKNSPTPRTTPIRLSDADMDRPIYRIFSLWFLEQGLHNLWLAPPSAWDDPFEDMCSKMAWHNSNGKQNHMLGYTIPAYAQCWSFEGESDVLLRAYSRVLLDPTTKRNLDPRYEGVQVRTTPRKLINALDFFLSTNKDPTLTLYFGAVEYDDDKAIGGAIAQGLQEVGPHAMGNGKNRATTLLYKRAAYKHEQEARIIALTKQYVDGFSIKINPNELFDEITFDPRLVYFERLIRIERFKQLGYTGKFTEYDARYQMTFFLTQLDRDW